MHLTRPDGYAEMVVRQRRRSQEPKTDTERTEYSETIIEENLALETEGYLYHPGLFEFALSGLFGWVQHSAEDIAGDQRQTSSDDGTVREYSLQGEILKRRDIRGFVRARRDRSLEPRPFQSSLETTTTDYGAVWRYVHDKTPTSLRFDYTEVHFDPLGDLEEDHRRKNTGILFQTEYRFSSHSVLSLDYKHETVEEEPRARDYDADEVRLKHRWEFGRGFGSWLETDVNYRNQRGFLDLERFRWRQNLRLQHTDRLRSRYRFEMLDRTRGSLTDLEPIGERAYSLFGSLEHRLYDNLVSQFSASGLTQDFDTGAQIDRLGTQATFNYRRTNPWGMLLGDYSFHVNAEDRVGPYQAAERFDEAHIFSEPDPVVLTEPRVDISSIVIRDDDRITVYLETQDFTVHKIGDRVEIHRVPTGRIADGQTVLIDYLVQIGGTYRLTTVGQMFSLRQRFDMGLSPYYRLRWQHQRLSADNRAGITPEDISDHVFGLEFRRGPLTLTGEFQTRYSNITPLDSIRVAVDYNRRFRFGATGTLRARWMETTYGAPNDRESTFYSAEGRLRYPISRGLLVEGAALYHSEEDSLSGSDDGVDLDLSLEWLIRDIEVRVTYEYGRYNDDFADSETSALYIQVRRNF
ncbi:MAG: hypothetical protein KJ749_00875 [Planctomycetes bacterium]|nr:hypothetical protein [Planctomycetota bacterium]